MGVMGLLVVQGERDGQGKGLTVSESVSSICWLLGSVTLNM